MGEINVGWIKYCYSNNAPRLDTAARKDHLQPLLASLKRLAKALPELGSLAADMYFNLLLAAFLFTRCYEAVIRILTACLIEFSPPDIWRRLPPFQTNLASFWDWWGASKTNLECLLCATCTSTWLRRTVWNYCWRCLHPRELDLGSWYLVRWILVLSILSLYFGRMTFAPSNFLYVNDYEYEKDMAVALWPFIILVHFNSCKSIWAYQIYGHRFYNYSHLGLCRLPRLMERLFEHGVLVMRHFANLCNIYLSFSVLQAILHLWWCAEWLSQSSQSIQPSDTGILDSWDGKQPKTSKDRYNILSRRLRGRGSRYLLQAVRQHSVHIRKLSILSSHGNMTIVPKQQIKLRDGLAAAVIHMARNQYWTG